MSDDKPPTQRLGRLTSGVGKSKDGLRLGSLKGDGAEAGTSAGAGGSGLASRFKPKNFNKAEQGPVPETKLAEPLPDANARRSHRNNRSDRGGGHGRGGGTSRANYESEVVFGGMVGAGASVKIDITSKTELGYKPEPEPLSGSPTAKPTKRLVKASGAFAGEGGASGSKQKKKDRDGRSDSESGFSSCSSSDKDDDDDGLLGEEDEYLPTLLSSLGKSNGVGNGKKSGRTAAAAASVTAIPEELMARPPESETELNRQLAWLTEQNVESAGLVLFQLPSVLPIPVPHQSNGGGAINGNFGADGAGPSTSTAAAAAAAKAAEGRPASLAELPPGKIGKLLVLRNGSVKMQIGEVLFDVSPGIPCQMLQEFAAVDPISKTLTMLGEIEKRIVVTPNIDSLLSDDPLPEWKYANKNARGEAANGAVGGKGGAAAAAALKKKKGGAHAVVILTDSSSSSDDDEEMVDAGQDKDRGKNSGVLEMIEDDDGEATQDEEEAKRKNRPAPKARRTARK
ncbi:hypothetical protein Ndes2526B_g01311 [Nannochloris sp. 'desiccata']|nr:putative DNA-directed RNA polymerase III subunit RPC4 [Chlorella desiccata (nom. nud.)]